MKNNTKRETHRDERQRLWTRIRSLGGIGVMSLEQAKKTSVGVLRVLNLMEDQRWYLPEKICDAAGGPHGYASEGLRRMRELRAMGYEIDRQQRTEGTWVYRLRESKAKPKSEPMHDKPYDWLSINVEQLRVRLTVARKSGKGINLHSREVALACAILDGADGLLSTDAINSKLTEQDNDK